MIYPSLSNGYAKVYNCTSNAVQQGTNQYNLFRTAFQFESNSWGEDGGQPVVAKFRRSPQLFLIYRIYEAKDGRAKLLCYDNSEGRIGSSGLVGQRTTYAIWGYKLKKGIVSLRVG